MADSQNPGTAGRRFLKWTVPVLLVAAAVGAGLLVHMRLAGQAGGPAQPPGASSPAELIQTILACSRAKNYAALKPRICAVPLGPLGVLTQDVAIQYIKDQDKLKMGDFCYSDEAAEILLKEHADKFSAEIPDGWMRNMTEEDFAIP